MSTAGVVESPQPYTFVRIKRVPPPGVSAFEDEVFAKVPIRSTDDVADLAARVCETFGWGPPTRAGLFLVAAGGSIAPTPTEIAAALGDATKRLGEGLSLADAVVASGAWLVARVPAPAPAIAPAHGAAAAAQQWTSNRLRTALVEARVAVDDSFVQRVLRSRALQNSLAFCSGPDDIAAFHELAMRDPQSETRANVLNDTGVTIDGDIYVPHRTTALFKWAFDRGVPRVLKLPQGAGAADRECRLYDVVGAEARAAGVRLVPVRLLRLSGTHRVGQDVTSLRAGVLMPPYPVTLAQVPSPAVSHGGRRALASLEAAVDFLFARGWVHGDVKPSNIFLAADGEAWLGDFGSSFRVECAKEEFSGGTPSFQVKGVAPDAPEAAFDRAALVVTFVSALGLLEAGSRDDLQWPPGVVRNALDNVDAEDLRDALAGCLGRALSAAGVSD